MAEAVRFATADDIQAIMALEQGAIAHPWPEEDLRRLISDDDKFALVIEGEDGIEGYIGVSVVVGEASVGNLVVKQDRRGRGLGTKLVEALIAELGTIAVYTRCGFTEYNRRRDYYGAGRDARLMKRAVAGA